MTIPAIEALTKHQRQLDADGVFVGVSRQALDELLAAYAPTQAEAKEAGIRAALRIVEENMLCGPDGVEVLLPRGNSGNKVGLAYAAAIRALLKEGEAR